MSSAALQRQAALVGAALLAVLLVVVLDRSGGTSSVAARPALGQRQWETAVVSVTGLKPAGACVPVGTDAHGVVHPVLPCGVKLVLSANGREVTVEVLESGAVPTGDFALTPALASDLGVGDGDRIRWRFPG